MKWVNLSWIWIALALLIGVVLGFAVFGAVEYQFPTDFWFSIGAASFSAIGAIGAQLKVWLEVRKLLSDGEKAKDELRTLQQEIRKGEREEELAPTQKQKLDLEVQRLRDGQQKLQLEKLKIGLEIDQLLRAAEAAEIARLEKTVDTQKARAIEKGLRRAEGDPVTTDNAVTDVTVSEEYSRKQKVVIELARLLGVELKDLT